MTTPHETTNPTTYVLAFVFQMSGPIPFVCLIEKKKPAWQAGKLNGVGGKVEPGDLSLEFAMAREFSEETGVQIEPRLWHRFHAMQFGNGAVIHCFTAFMPRGTAPRTMEEEQVGMYPLGEHAEVKLILPIIENLRWLVPMAYHELIRPATERMLVI